MTDEQKALEALARAYDHEEAACMGEPSPWVSADAEGDDEWKSERIVAARAGLEAYRSALSLPVQPVAWEPYQIAIRIGAEVRRRNRVGKDDEAGSISPCCELAATILVLEALHDCGILPATTPPVPPSPAEWGREPVAWINGRDLRFLREGSYREVKVYNYEKDGDVALTTPPVPEGAGEPGSQEHAKTIVRDARALLDRLVMHSPSHGVDEFLDAIQDARLLIARIDGAE